jgi:hypothetical protein
MNPSGNQGEPFSLRTTFHAANNTAPLMTNQSAKPTIPSSIMMLPKPLSTPSVGGITWKILEPY